MLPPQYQDFYNTLAKQFPAKSLVTDPLRTVAYGADASFYQLVPKIVVIVDREDEVRLVLQEASRRNLPVTFRAAGTSLSGQALTDSILVCLGKKWQNYRIFDKARKIQLQPGIIGADANRYLAEFGKKIGPDPASIDAAKIGGILANNASGMCCGVAQNSYQTLDSLRILLADGTVLDTADDKSRAAFRRSHPHILEGLKELRSQVLADADLAARIGYKYKIKNTTGYSLNALVDFKDPFDILQHLMVGSEGTLAFISEVIYRTVTEHAHKASALMLFPDVATACSAIPLLKNDGLEVAAAELMDRAALASVENEPGMPDDLAALPDNATALLVETRATSAARLKSQETAISKALSHLQTLKPVTFTAVPSEYQSYWKIRKGLFPAVGAVRETGTTVIIEDVAFQGEHLAAAAGDLQRLFRKYHYTEAIIFGHALEGNLHFCFTQDFSRQSKVARYRDFMEDVVSLVVDKYQGSLKAEHGTGRNMAPFVEKEWGSAAYRLMKGIKALFDPKGLLNPGVLINDDAEAHIRNLKPLPATHEIVDKCIECGFCEPVCPSRNLTFTPRQRIAARRELVRRALSEAPERERNQLTRAYRYPGMDTCAADGMCSTRCPVGIDTGKMVKALRKEAHGDLANTIADRVADHFSAAARTVATTLDVVDRVHQAVGTPFMEKAARTARALSGDLLPLWNREMPTSSSLASPAETGEEPLQVVYFPACPSRSMGGPSRAEEERSPLPEKTAALLKKAGYQVIYPEGLNALCCGQAFESKGFHKQADRKSDELNMALLKASRNGRIPVLCDTSPCLQRMRQTLSKNLTLYEPIEFVLECLADKLTFTVQPEKVALHITCSARKLGLEQKMIALAKACAEEVVVPDDIYCCGFAGDRGFSNPELNASALDGLRDHVCDCDAGYSTSKTCEIGLALHSEIPYRSLLYLVDAATTPRENSSP